MSSEKKIKVEKLLEALNDIQQRVCTTEECIKSVQEALKNFDISSIAKGLEEIKVRFEKQSKPVQVVLDKSIIHEHIKNCPECQKLIQEYAKKLKEPKKEEHKVEIDLKPIVDEITKLKETISTIQSAIENLKPKEEKKEVESSEQKESKEWYL